MQRKKPSDKGPDDIQSVGRRGESLPSAGEMIKYLLPGFEISVASDRRVYLTPRFPDRRTTYEVGSDGCQSFLRRKVWECFHIAAPERVIKEIESVIRANATESGTREDVFVRVGIAGGKVYVNLADEAGHVVEVTPETCRVTTQSPVKFWSPPSTRQIPLPEFGGEGLAALDH